MRSTNTAPDTAIHFYDGPSLLKRIAIETLMTGASYMSERFELAENFFGLPRGRSADSKSN